MKKCKVVDCGLEHSAKGYCNTHYLRVKRYGRITGSPNPNSKNIPFVDRLLGSFDIDEETQCWDWSGYVSPAGWGRIKHSGVTKFAHRASYEHYIGYIPDKLVIDHLCENKRCVNPFHLEPVTNRENIRRWFANRRYEKQNTC